MNTQEVINIINQARIKINEGPEAVPAPQSAIENADVETALETEAQALSDLLG